MLFYVQMKWNYQGRISQDSLWNLESIEGEHGLAGLRSGMVKSLYKVASQHRVIAIVDVATAEDLDRNSMGALPLREYLEFEHVWALRDYQGFVADAKAGFTTVTSGGDSCDATTRDVAGKWFSGLTNSKIDDALSLLDDDVIWDNIPSTPGVSDVAPWLGSYRGKPAVIKSFEVWAAKSQMLSFNLLSPPIIEGGRAVGLVHEHAKCLANGKEYDLYVSTYLTVRNGKIVEWRVFWDISPLIKAYRGV